MKTLEEFLEMEPCSITLVTHDGVCHTDDVFATALLENVLGDRIKEVRRTRNSSDLERIENPLIYDVFGGELDHHQGVENQDGRPLAALGKIWRWGKKEITELYQLDEESWRNIDQCFIKGIDLTDNTGELNPLSYALNCTRTVNGALEERTFEKLVEVAKVMWNNIISAEQQASRNRREMISILESTPITEINGKKGKIINKFLPTGKTCFGLDFLVWPDKDQFMVKRFDGQLKHSGAQPGEIPGIEFVHPGGWLGKVSSKKDLEKVL